LSLRVTVVLTTAAVPDATTLIRHSPRGLTTR